jgi:glyoxylase-like metal-dependent hydrolase (beta-lactamase superfamily II)
VRTKPPVSPPAATPAPAQAGSQGAASAPADAKVTIRFYCQGIGDCHLLRFKKEDGSVFWMMIDCGIHSSVKGGSAKIDAIVDNVALLTGKRLDVLVLTHEHWDHNSGFFSARDKFKEFKVGEVWMGWTENPADTQARDFDKFKGQALTALQRASQRLDGSRGLSPHLSAIQVGLRQVLGFNFGAKGEKVREARDAAVQLAAKDDRKYYEP